jgi:hypothetical protein
MGGVGGHGRGGDAMVHHPPYDFNDEVRLVGADALTGPRMQSSCWRGGGLRPGIPRRKAPIALHR